MQFWDDLCLKLNKPLYVLTGCGLVGFVYCSLKNKQFFKTVKARAKQSKDGGIDITEEDSYQPCLIPTQTL